MVLKFARLKVKNKNLVVHCVLRAYGFSQPFLMWIQKFPNALPVNTCSSMCIKFHKMSICTILHTLFPLSFIRRSPFTVKLASVTT